MIVSAQNNRVTIAQNKLCSVLHTQRVKTFLDCAQLWCHILTHFGVLVLPGTVDKTLAFFLTSTILDDKHEKIVRINQFFLFLYESFKLQ